jgi:hypothetical protein
VGEMFWIETTRLNLMFLIFLGVSILGCSFYIEYFGLMTTRTFMENLEVDMKNINWWYVVGIPFIFSSTFIFSGLWGLKKGISCDQALKLFRWVTMFSLVFIFTSGLFGMCSTVSGACLVVSQSAFVRKLKKASKASVASG